MGVRLDSPWQLLNASVAEAVGGYLGVYEVRSFDGNYLRIGYAGGKSQYGLRGEIECLLEKYGAECVDVRFEITSSYLSRYQELLMLHMHDYGRLPRDNAEDPLRLGIITPA